MAAKVAENTKRRMKLLDLYGPDVFSEALLDPLKTINRDVLPRFLASENKTGFYFLIIFTLLCV